MKFSTRIDVDMPASDLFDIVGDFSRIERVLTARNVAVRRIDPARDPGTGLGWLLDFRLRGQDWSLRLDVTRFDRPSQITLEGYSDQFDLTIDLSVVALSRTTSRVLFETAVRPRGMRARLLLQTAKLGKVQLDKTYAKRFAEFLDLLRAA